MHERPTGLILCGGTAERLGGIDKPLRSFGGRPLLQHIVDVLQPQVGQLVINANRSRERYAGFGCAVIDDGAFAGCGPLAGVLAGLASIDGNLLCVPGDAPAIPPDLGARLAAAPAAAPIVYAHDGRGPQPLCCLLRADRHRGLHDDLRRYLEAGGRTPRDWFARHAAIAVDFSGTPSWAWSLNTPDEWAAAEARAANSYPEPTA